MDFALTEEQVLIRDMARDFASRELAPIAGDLDKEEKFPEKQLRMMGELGLMGVNIPEEYGGAEAGSVATSLAIMEIASGCASAAVTMSVTNMVAEVICSFGTEDQKRKYVPRICSGEYSCAAFGLSETGAGSDPGSMKTKAAKSRDEWILNGEKLWISHGDHAGVVVVWARTGGKGTRGLSAFLVEQGTPGFTPGKKEDKMGLRASTTVPLLFEDCRIPADTLLGEENAGFKVAMMALDGGRIGIASQAIGIARAAQHEAVEYAKERQQFSKPISSFQAVQWMLADNETAISAAESLTLQAAWLKQAKKPFTRQASMSKVFSTEMANEVCAKAVQIHGGYGYVKEYPVERHYRDVRVTTIYEGTNQVQRVVIGRELLK